MQLSARVTLTVVGMVVLLATGGCGTEEPVDTAAGTVPTVGASASPATTTAAEPGTKACELLALDAVTDLFGTAATVDEDKAKECVWIGKNGALHQLHLQLYTGQSYYSPARWGGTSSAVEGLGDEAFSVAKSPLGATVGFKRGDTVAFVNYQILLGGKASPGDAIDTLIALARAVEGKV